MAVRASASPLGLASSSAAPSTPGEAPLISVGVLGARGRMGTEVCRAVEPRD